MRRESPDRQDRERHMVPLAQQQHASGNVHSPIRSDVMNRQAQQENEGTPAQYQHNPFNTVQPPVEREN
jgi:hypothetical protein